MAAHTPRCPRCGYDQRGPISAWRESCPLEGTCTECGLVFRWAEVIQPEKFEPAWCVEFTLTTNQLLGATPRTLWMSFRPWRFWRAVKMAYPVRARKLCFYLAFLMLMTLGFYACRQTILAYRAWTIFKQEASMVLARTSPADVLANRLSVLKQEVSELQSRLVRIADLERGNQLPPDFDAPQRRSRMEARLEALTAQVADVQAQLAKTPPTVVTVRVSFVKPWLKALLTPLSDRTGQKIRYRGGSLSFPAAVEMSDYGHTSGTGAFAFGGASEQEWWVGNLGRVMFGWLLFLTLPAGFVLLPISRRRAKVRWAHLGRVFAYSLAIALVALWAAAAIQSLAFATLVSDSIASSFNAALLSWGVGLAACGWWICAIRAYLQMPHALLYIGVVAILTVLAMILGLWLIDPTMALAVFNSLIWGELDP